MMSSEPVHFEEVEEVSTVVTSSVAASRSKKTVANFGFNDGIKSVFGNLSNCSIGHVTININPESSSKYDDFDEIAKNIDL